MKSFIGLTIIAFMATLVIAMSAKLVFSACPGALLSGKACAYASDTACSTPEVCAVLKDILGYCGGSCYWCNGPGATPSAYCVTIQEYSGKCCETGAPQQYCGPGIMNYGTCGTAQCTCYNTIQGGVCGDWKMECTNEY